MTSRSYSFCSLLLALASGYNVPITPIRWRRLSECTVCFRLGSRVTDHQYPLLGNRIKQGILEITYKKAIGASGKWSVLTKTEKLR